jgi:photosystem II stability/assembly factor-like uncharacterized protein/tetratricopeptide (TPR) repeat protein
MNDIVNPYIAGAPVLDARMFFGREDVFDWIQTSLTGRYADHTLVIHGQRRVGKTSVLKQLGNHLPQRYVPIFFDLQGRTHTTLDRFLWWLAREIVRVLKQERDFSFPVPEKEVFSQDIEYFEHRFLPDLHTALLDNVLLLTFDEFDNLEESEVKEELAQPLIDYLRRLMVQEGLNFIFSIGSSGRKLENMQSSYTEFFKTALYKKISFLSREQSNNLITRPVEGLLEYDPQAVERIYDITSGHPYFTQLICHELFSICQKTGELEIQEKSVEDILEDVVERGTVNLKFTWDEAVDIEKWSLAALAHLEGKTDTAALVDFLHKQRIRFSESDLTSGLLHLREKDILTEDNRFVIYLLKLWLKKNRPIEQVREELTEVNPIANRYIEIGLEFQDSGQFEKAIENFREALAVAPEHVQAQVSIGLAYMAQQDFNQAVAEFEKALAMDDEDVAARAGLCGAYLALGNLALSKNKAKEALASYQKVLAINAEHTEARQHVSEILQLRAEKALTDGRDEEALAAFSEALKFTPEDERLASRYEQAKTEKRTKVLASLLSKADKEQSAHNWNGALSVLDQANEIDPGNENVQNRLTVIKEEQHKAHLAVLLARADHAQQVGRWGLVIAALEDYLEAEPADEKTHQRLETARQKQIQIQIDELKLKANNLTRQEHFEEAISAWQELQNLSPTQSQTFQIEIEKVQQAQALANDYAKGQAALAKKNYDQAVAKLKNVIDQDVNYKDATHLFAQAVELRRTARKWWQNRFLWAGSGIIILVAIGWLIYPFIKTLLAASAVQPTPLLTQVIGTAPNTTVPVTPLPTITPIPTAIPLTWARSNSGQFLPRDPITAIVIDPNDTGVIYIATQEAGLYKSIDGGISWQPIHNGLGRAKVFSLIMDPRDSMILYAGTQLGGVYKTTDGGLTWHAMNEGIDIQRSEWVAIVVLDAQNSQHLFFTHSNAIYETVDGGHFWRLVRDDNSGSCPRNYIGLALDPSDGNILYTADFGGSYGDNSCQGGIYKSNDSGLTWTITNFQSQPHEIQWNTLWIDPNIGHSLYISSADKLWVSNDQGETWTESNPTSCNALVFDKQDPLIAYCGNNDQFMITKDGGKQWSVLAHPGIGQDVSLSISPQDRNTLFWGTTGLYMSTDGGKTWNEHGSGLGSRGWELKIAPADSSVLYAQGLDSALYLSKDEGRNWDIIGNGQSLSFDNVGRNLYAMNNGEYLAISRDDGKSWDQIALPVTPSQAIAVHPTNPNRVYAIYTRNTPPYIYYSDDLGKTWLSSTGMQDINDARLFFDHDQGNQVYAVGDVNYSRSNDGGITWENCGDSVFTIWSSILDARAVVDWRDNDHLFVATRGNGIVTSIDGCQSWQQSNTGLGSLFVNTIAIDPNNPDTLYAATDGGAYISTNGGQTWGVIDDGLLGATVVYSIVVDKDSNVYAATPYGIFKLEGK